ncbi:endonuclease/exonuclease/phosphatase family protein [Enterovibrio sp. ZSDZ35]|uniref:Endonuclease/exonuclease/phosphatase family protein n=1 Tax=Enterovibrio qingdaonensis TaxID=2899818 RepID=A0ABT5QV08_9GAMM|nr:endonuclease/exonuclease/phosphatase family protein [Enterovibrio sp. ZSDZ35]MDD1784126.1 endonuclease/exonuclease/phosphatase family protein [Enterovibrio sp. ZSDZ35]
MKQLKGRWVLLGTAILIVAISLVYVMVDVPDSARLASGDGTLRCRDYTSDSSIDIKEPINVAVWNIYKQQNSGWDQELDELSKTHSLILLQEAQSKPQLLHYIEEKGWHSNQAYAFAVNGEIAGVMTLSEVMPREACAYTKIEPYLRLPKSALYSAFPLSNGETLSVINIHSINFTFGIVEYKEQLEALVDAVRDVKGPLIIAGDFNTWSEERLDVVRNALNEVGIKEVNFASDQRLKVFGHPLDHLFYRGLTLHKSSSKETNASDHAWLDASFSFSQ